MTASETLAELDAIALAAVARLPATDSGHGQVWKRPDGVTADCGGPKKCDDCSSDALMVAAMQQSINAVKPTSAAVVEIVERHRGERMPEIGTGSILVPNEIRINGQRLWAPQDSPPVVERIEVGTGMSAVLVTLTVMARRVVIDDEPGTP